MGCEAHTFFPWNLIGSLNKLTTLARLRFNLTAEADVVEYSGTRDRFDAWCFFEPSLACAYRN
jgi:hypothetical protein